MKTNILTLCDYAQSIAGKITIVGTFNQITSKEFPFTYNANISFVAKISSDDDIKGDILCKMVDPLGSEVVEPIKAVVEARRQSEKVASLDFLVNWTNLTFTIPGTYKVIFSIGESYSETTDLYLVENK